MGQNIFKLLEIETNENIHSTFIASIINSNEFAKEAFIQMIKDVCKKDLDIPNLKAQTEVSLSTNETGRVDIYLTDYDGNEKKENTRIIIENKIYAGDQNAQLYRYHTHLTNYEHKALFYLTLEGKKPSNYSTFNFDSKVHLKEKEDYYLISYNENIKKWLNDILISTEIAKDLKIYIIDYLQIINELTKMWRDLENFYNSNEDVNSLEQKSYLELKFWEFIEQRIIEYVGSSNLAISNKRYYSYNKILKCQNNKSQRNYGIIFEFKNNINIRIAVKANECGSFQLFISKGSMDIKKNEWNNEGQKDLNYYTNKLKNKDDMKAIGKEVISEIYKILFNLT